MIYLSRFVWILVLCLMAACGQKSESPSELMAEGRQIGSFRGLVQIERLINDRLYRADRPLMINGILGQDLNFLLGSFTGGTGISQREGANPNPVNVLLWEILMDDTAQMIVGGIKAEELDESFQSAAKELFALNREDDASDELRDFWHIFMRYDAPETEREAWVAAMQSSGSDFKTEENPKRSVLQSLLLHPYFLLEH